MKKTLKMEGGISHGMRYLHNSKWDVNISRHGISIHNRKTGKGYAINEQNQETDVLDDFLIYYRECCENIGMDIKP